MRWKFHSLAGAVAATILQPEDPTFIVVTTVCSVGPDVPFALSLLLDWWAGRKLMEKKPHWTLSMGNERAHWLIVWIVLALVITVLLQLQLPSEVYSIGYGVALGNGLHVVVDMPTHGNKELGSEQYLWPLPHSWGIIGTYDYREGDGRSYFAHKVEEVTGIIVLSLTLAWLYQVYVIQFVTLWIMLHWQTHVLLALYQFLFFP